MRRANLPAQARISWATCPSASEERFLIPYPNRIVGEPSSDGKSVITHWRGHTLALPANFPSKRPGGRVVAIHGLITQAKVEDLQTQTTADGQTVTGVIHAGDFGGHWLSDTDLNLTIALTGDAVDATITAKNVGKEPEPMSIGWHPYFQIPSGHRAQARLHIPASMMALVNNYSDAFPTGQLKPVKGTEYDYNAPDGVALDDHFLDDNFSHLQRTQGAAEVKLIDPEANYGLTVSALSPEIRTVQVYSPKNATFVAIEDQFNYVDPFGKQWKGMDTGMVTLRPGQSVTWKVRLGLFKPAIGFTDKVRSKTVTAVLANPRFATGYLERILEACERRLRPAACAAGIERYPCPRPWSFAKSAGGRMMGRMTATQTWSAEQSMATSA